MHTLPILAAAALTAPAALAQATYVDNTQNSGLIAEHDPVPGHPSVMLVGGGTVGDFNSDGWPDFFLPSGGTRPDYLFINDGDGTFTEQAVAWGLTDLHMGVGSAVGDFDNDGWQDLYVCSFGAVGSGGAGQNRLYRNNGNGTFTDVAAAAGVNNPSDGNNCYGAAFGDYDKDGDLDLYVTAYSFGQRGNTLYQNNGDGTFADVTVAAGLTDAYSSRGFVPNFVDFNQDSHIDIMLIADTGTSKYYQSQGDGTFVKRNTVIPDLRLPNAMGQAIADLDNDLDLDLYVSDIYYPASGIGGNRLYVNDGSNAWWEEVAPAAGVNECGWGWGIVATDMDNDGWLDLASTNGWFSSWDNYPTRLFHNTRDGKFAEVAGTCGLTHYYQGRGLYRLDADRDGDEDLIITASNDPLAFFQNETNNGNHWLRVSFDTSDAPGLAPHGHGVEVFLRQGQRTLYRQMDSRQSFLGQSEWAFHFGLKDLDKVDEMEVRWPNGRRSIFTGVQADQHLVIRASEPVLSVSAVQPNAPATVTVSGVLPNSSVTLAMSDVGAGPTVTPIGDVMVTWPFTTFDLQSDATGVASISNYIPGWVSGRTFYLQAYDPGSSTLSNPLAVTVP